MNAMRGILAQVASVFNAQRYSCVILCLSGRYYGSNLLNN